MFAFLHWQDIRHNAFLSKFWSLWFPVQCLTFSVIPEHLRVTFITCVCFFWMIVFSSLSASSTISHSRLSHYFCLTLELLFRILIICSLIKMNEMLCSILLVLHYILLFALCCSWR
mmetsp:Transcript_22608/g.40801  ORF Transcript_22608/g.40801 Transcript_22608/m.40801 type:complete len:116 (-) Transcript_22608:54-401(-)